MQFHWERYDTFLSGFARGLGPAILNMFILGIVFVPQVELLYQWVIDLAPQASEGILKPLFSLWTIALEKIKDAKFESLWEASTGLILSLFVILGLLIYVIDLTTRWVGNLVPVRLEVDEDLLMKRRSLGAFFISNDAGDHGCHAYLDARNRAEAWADATIQLDARLEPLPSYRGKRDGLEREAQAVKGRFTYIKAYIVLLLLGLMAATLFSPQNSSSGSVWDRLPWNLVITTVLVLIALVMASLHCRHFLARIERDIAMLDLETYLALTKKNRLPAKPVDRTGNRRHPIRFRFGLPPSG